jgi:hypothetical protein
MPACWVSGPRRPQGLKGSVLGAGLLVEVVGVENQGLTLGIENPPEDFINLAAQENGIIVFEHHGLRLKAYQGSAHVCGYSTR